MPVHINASGFCNVFHSIFQMDVILRGKNYEIRSSKRNGSIIAHKFLDVSKYGVNRDFISSGKPQNRRRFETRPKCHRPACRFITSAISTVTVLPPHTDRQTDKCDRTEDTHWSRTGANVCLQLSNIQFQFQRRQRREHSQ